MTLCTKIYSAHNIKDTTGIRWVNLNILLSASTYDRICSVLQTAYRPRVSGVLLTGGP